MAAAKSDVPPAPPLLLVLDVDGVTRQGVTDAADPAVVAAVRLLADSARTAARNVHVAFVSGTPSDLAPVALPEWCGGNAPLSYVFGDHFNDLVAEGTVSIYGQLGGDELRYDPALGRLVSRPVLFFTQEEQLQCFAALLDLYHEDVAATHPELAERFATVAAQCLKTAREAEAFDPAGPSSTTPIAFEPYALLVRGEFDAQFRLVSNGATIEYHDFKSAWKAPDTKLLPPKGAFVSSGIAHRDHQEFRFVIVMCTNKGATVKRIKDEYHHRQRLRQGDGDDGATPAPFLLTVGDTAIDYPMHVLADAGFHVGAPAVWDARRAAAEHQHVALVQPMGVSSTATVVAAVARWWCTEPSTEAQKHRREVLCAAVGEAAGFTITY